MYSSVLRSVNLSTTILYPGNHRVFAFLDVRRFLLESPTIKQALREMPTFHANQKKKKTKNIKQTQTKITLQNGKKVWNREAKNWWCVQLYRPRGYQREKNPVSTCNKQIGINECVITLSYYCYYYYTLVRAMYEYIINIPIIRWCNIIPNNIHVRVYEYYGNSWNWKGRITIYIQIISKDIHHPRLNV